MPRKKKVKEEVKEPLETKCSFCGAEIEPGHYCKCPAGRKAMAKKLFEQHYAGKKRAFEE